MGTAILAPILRELGRYHTPNTAWFVTNQLRSKISANLSQHVLVPAYIWWTQEQVSFRDIS